MTEAEYIYTLDALYKKVYDYSHNDDVRWKCQCRIQLLTGELYRAYGKYHHQYSSVQIQDLIAEHILLGE